MDSSILITVETCMKAIACSVLFTTLLIANNAYSFPGSRLFGPKISSVGPVVELQASKKGKKARKGGGKTTFDKGSGETTKERDTRLLRECKGRPNAGACLGYAS
jgi:hypothetical protein